MIILFLIMLNLPLEFCNTEETILYIIITALLECVTKVGQESWSEKEQSHWSRECLSLSSAMP